jgi:hypothetical protein
VGAGVLEKVRWSLSLFLLFSKRQGEAWCSGRAGRQLKREDGGMGMLPLRRVLVLLLAAHMGGVVELELHQCSTPPGPFEAVTGCALLELFCTGAAPASVSCRAAMLWSVPSCSTVA